MATPFEWARELNATLKDAGYQTTFMEDLMRMNPSLMPLVALKLGVPTVLDPAFGGDCIFMFTGESCKMSTDIIRFSPHQLQEVSNVCNAVNAQKRFVTLYASPEEGTVVAQRDFYCVGDDFFDEVIESLPDFRSVVQIASPFLLRAIGQNAEMPFDSSVSQIRARLEYYR